MSADSSPYTELNGKRAFVTGGAQGIGRAIAHALARSGVKLAMLGRLEEPEDVADVVVFLCSNKARFMTGQGINVTGGVYMT